MLAATLVVMQGGPWWRLCVRRSHFKPPFHNREVGSHQTTGLSAVSRPTWDTHPRHLRLTVVADVLAARAVQAEVEGFAFVDAVHSGVVPRPPAVAKVPCRWDAMAERYQAGVCTYILVQTPATSAVA